MSTSQYTRQWYVYFFIDDLWGSYTCLMSCHFIYLSFFLNSLSFAYYTGGLNISLYAILFLPAGFTVLFRGNELVYLLFYYLILCDDANPVLNKTIKIIKLKLQDTPALLLRCSCPLLAWTTQKPAALVQLNPTMGASDQGLKSGNKTKKASGSKNIPTKCNFSSCLSRLSIWRYSNLLIMWLF